MKLVTLSLIYLVIPRQSLGFTCNNGQTFRRPKRRASCNSRLYGSFDPLAREGDWTAYLDEDNTGLVYYFNGRTGESLWEPPTKSFPEVRLTASQLEIMKKRQGVAGKKEEDGKAGGGFFGLFGGSEQEFNASGDSTVVQQQKLEVEKVKKKGAGTFSFSGVFGVEKKEAAVPEDLVVEEEKGGGSFSFSSVFGGEKKDAATTDVVVEEEKTKPGEGAKKFAVKGLFRRKRQEEGEDLTVFAEQAAAASPSSETAKLPSIAFPDVASVFKAKPQLKDIIVPAEKPIKVEMASQVLPHPEKVSWGGEDKVFLKGRTFGVFDGVSGAEKEDGKELYSATLAVYMKATVPNVGQTQDDLRRTLLSAAQFADEEATGASTACVASVGEDGVLRAINLGDCVVLVIRDGEIVARSREIVHYFDCPYQLSIDSPDGPKDSTTLRADVFPGDIIVMGSDGVFDNLSDEAVCAAVGSVPEKSTFIAKSIVDQSRRVSLNETAVTPYAKLAEKNRYEDYKQGVGGKVDDISCVVVRCT